MIRNAVLTTVSAAVLVSASPSNGTAQGEDLRLPAAGRGYPPGTQQAKAEPSLAAEDRERVDPIRRALAEDDRDAARALLHEIVRDLGERAVGSEQAPVGLLLELVRLAGELGSLQDCLELREAVLDLRRRSLPEEHRDVLAAKLDLAVSRKELGDLVGARQLEEEVLAARTRLLPADHPDLLAAKGNLGSTKYDLGDFEGAFALAQEVLEARSSLLPPHHPSLLTARQNLASACFALGDLERALALFEEVLSARTRVLPPDHPELLRAKENLALTKEKLGDLAGARALEEEVVAGRTRIFPRDHPSLLDAQHNLAATLYTLGELEDARVLFEGVLSARRLLSPQDPGLPRSMLGLAAVMEELGDLVGGHQLEETAVEALAEILPTDHPYLVEARENLAGTKLALGDLEGSRRLFEEVLEVRARLFPPDHPDRLKAQLNVAVVRGEMGDLAGARAIEEVVLAAYERTLPEDHPDLLGARQNLAGSLYELGDLAGARELFETVLEASERTLPAEHPDLRLARHNLATVLSDIGDLHGARQLQEAVLADLERTFPADHPDLLAARQNLAATLRQLGDLPGARALFELVLAAREQGLPAGHPDLLEARLNLASSMSDMGDLTGARALEEAGLETFEQSLPADHPNLLMARQNLAVTLKRLGDLAGARALEEAVLEARERLLQADHPDLLMARLNLGETLRRTGDLARARSLEDSAFASAERILPADHPLVLEARQSLVETMACAGDLEGVRKQLPVLASGVLARLASCLAVSAREAREVAWQEGKRFSAVLFLCEMLGTAAASSSLGFEIVETQRCVSNAAGSRLSARGDPELDPCHREAARIRGALNDLVLGGPGEDEDGEVWARRIDALARERDQNEAVLRRKWAEAGGSTGAIAGPALAAALPVGAVAVGYRRYERRRLDPGGKRIESAGEHLLAHVVRADGAITRVELGAAEELDELATRWRASIGQPLLGSRGVGLEPPPDERSPEHAVALGRELCHRILRPVQEASGGAVVLYVCLDDLLYLIPLDALPLEDGVVGDRYRLFLVDSFATLLAPRRPASARPSLVALGGVSYEASPADVVARAPSWTRAASSSSLSVSPPLSRGERGSELAFPPLAETGKEVMAVAELFEHGFERHATLLTGTGASKSALAEQASTARFLHIATHGYFEPETIRSSADPVLPHESWSLRSISERVTGLAPMTLCGLALAGANRGRDALGRVPGILTAEELATFDLRNCELAVLSACETNVGIRRAGQGIQSLQTALHAAGARTAITSLWKVDDAATRRLFELFYTKLWRSKLGKHDALWQAKMALRAEGHPPRDWAGWILTGDPE